MKSRTSERGRCTPAKSSPRAESPNSTREIRWVGGGLRIWSGREEPSGKHLNIENGKFTFLGGKLFGGWERGRRSSLLYCSLGGGMRGYKYFCHVGNKNWSFPTKEASYIQLEREIEDIGAGLGGWAGGADSCGADLSPTCGVTTFAQRREPAATDNRPFPGVQ